MRRIFIVAVATAVVVITLLTVRVMTNNKKGDVEYVEKPGQLVQAIYPKYSDVAQHYSSTGKLMATYRFEMFAQVEGQLLTSAQKFREGNSYRKGEVLLEIDHQEYSMNLLASKSEFISQLTSLLPDLKIDYPDTYEQWKAYVAQIDVKKPLPNLPTPKSEQERFFLSGRNIYNMYYGVRSSEERLIKYVIRAPFNGIVTKTSVDAGTAVRSGSELGTFINPNIYDLEITAPISRMSQIAVGTKAKISSSEVSNTWDGKVVRMGGDIDQASQSIKVFIRVEGENLKEGMYLTADISQDPFQDAMALPRKLISDNNHVFIIENGFLRSKEVEVIARQDDKAIIRGLEEGSAVLSTVVKGAYDGLKVRLD